MTDNPWDCCAPPSKVRSRVNRNSLIAKIGVGAVLAAFVGLVTLGAYSLLGDSQPAQRRVVQISLLVPPPPPPPPPREVKLPEPTEEPPEVVREQVRLPDPEKLKRPEETPTPSEPLRSEFKGTGRGDTFALAPGTGGQGGPSIGGGGGDRARFAWFAAAIEMQLKEHLYKNERLRKSGYRITMRLWISPDGSIERYELLDSAGDPELDRSLRAALDGMPRLEQRPPAEMPQPVTLRVTARAVNG